MKGVSSASDAHHTPPRVVQPIVVKQGSLFLLCTSAGDILPDSEQGLYFHDMRYLSRQTLWLDGQSPISLLSVPESVYWNCARLTRVEIWMSCTG